MTERPGVHPPARTPRAHRPVQRPAARWPRSSRSSWPAIVLVGITTPLGTTGDGPAPSTRGRPPFIIGRRRPQGSSPATSAPEFAVTARRRLDLPADRPRRQADPPRRPARQGRLGQLLGELVPAVPAGDADPARRWPSATATAASRSSAISVQETIAGRRRGLRRALRARLHDRLRCARARLPRVQGVRLPTQFFIDRTA